MSRKQPRPRRWQELAACHGLDTALFFPGQGESVDEARAVCSGCVVRSECAAYALDSGQRFGIWGGTTERDRRRARALRQVDQAGEVAVA